MDVPRAWTAQSAPIEGELQSCARGVSELKKYPDAGTHGEFSVENEYPKVYDLGLNKISVNTHQL